jgi:hypothetical protein
VIRNRLAIAAAFTVALGIAMTPALAGAASASSATPGAAVFYTVKIHTQNLTNADTTGDVRMAVTGSLRTATLPAPLDGTVAHNFQVGHTDTYSFWLLDFGTLQSMRLCLSNGDSAWFPDYVSVNGSTFPVNTWFPLGSTSTCKTFTPPATHYAVTFHTADVANAGTDGYVYLRIGGSTLTSQTLGPLDDKANNFERNRFDSFSFYLKDVGTLQKVDICFNSVGYSDWRLEYVVVNGVLFPVNAWFPGNHSYFCRTYDLTS